MLNRGIIINGLKLEMEWYHEVCVAQEDIQLMAFLLFNYLPRIALGPVY